MAAPERVRLFRLAWDLMGTQFGLRRTLYERFFNGDVVQLRVRRYAQYDYLRAEESVRRFMDGVYSGKLVNNCGVFDVFVDAGKRLVVHG